MAIGSTIQRSLPRLRALAESLMRDQIVVERKSGEPDPESGEAASVVVYEGKGKIQTYEASVTTPEVIGASVPKQTYRVDVPVGSFAPAIGDVVTVIAAASDPHLTGRAYRVEALLHKTTATAYRLQVSEVP